MTMSKIGPIITIITACLVGVIVSKIDSFYIKCLILALWTIFLTVFVLVKHSPEIKKIINKKKEDESDGPR